MDGNPRPLLDAASRQRIEAYWADVLGCSVETLRSPGTRVLLRQVHTSAFLFRYGDCCIWHVPLRFLSKVEREINGNVSVDQVFQKDFIEKYLGSFAQLILGPCPIAYCNRSMLRTPVKTPPSRRLASADRLAINDLATTCGTEAWEHGGVDPDHQPALFGCFVGDRLVSASSHEVWGSAIAHVGVVTAPEFRKQGFAKSAAWAATSHALDENLVPQWRTLATNLPSIRVGQAIGFDHLATHYHVRLASTNADSFN